MARDVAVDADRFALGLEELLGPIETKTELKLGKAVPKAARTGAKALRSEAGARWTGKTGRRYASGFSSHTTVETAEVVKAEIGNRNVPGLVHLLEKGHATLHGGRVAGRPHMAPVYDDVVVPTLLELVGKAVDEALEG